MRPVSLELLAPARDFDHGKCAIDCGADAVYIGAPSFGARAAASVSAEEIGRLCRYAHIFGVKVYAAMNTILFDDELAEAERMAHELWEAGVDALIVQDMAFAMMKLPPFEMHASTQTAALTPERVRLFEACGFKRVILERGFSIDDIRAVREASGVDLECFVHGAICVCNSGQCYMSHIVSGRSGNRGVCSQPCRSKFDLTDSDGRIMVRNSHLLSVNDLSLADRLDMLIDAGVTSFKIEGRLKDMAYIKNSVSFLRQRLDEAIKSREGFVRASHGVSEVSFTPDPSRTFTRGFTEYYLMGKRPDVASFSTAKAVGRRIGVVKSVNDTFFTLEGSHEPLTPGDGLCFVTREGVTTGTNVNRAEGDRIYPRSTEGLFKGAVVYRNLDKRFTDMLKSAAVTRVLPVDAEARFDGDRLEISLGDTRSKVTVVKDVSDYPVAENPERAYSLFVSQMRKSGGSPFRVERVEVIGDVPFMPASAVNALRRELLELLERKIIADYRRVEAPPLKPVRMLEGKGDYHLNVVNKYARRFYAECGLEEVEDGVELRRDFIGIEAMNTGYCIRRELGICLKEGGRGGSLRLINNDNIFRLEFDCRQCRMSVIYEGKRDTRRQNR